MACPDGQLVDQNILFGGRQHFPRGIHSFPFLDLLQKFTKVMSLISVIVWLLGSETWPPGHLLSKLLRAQFIPAAGKSPKLWIGHNRRTQIFVLHATFRGESPPLEIGPRQSILPHCPAFQSLRPPKARNPEGVPFAHLRIGPTGLRWAVFEWIRHGWPPDGCRDANTQAPWRSA